MPDLVGSALKGASAFVSVQLATRAVTFFLNVAVARLTDVRSFGTTVSLQLFTDMSMWWLKEGFRRAAVRDIDVGAAAGRRSALNVSAVGSAFTACFAIGLFAVWLRSPPDAAGASYTHACCVMLVASILEAVVEPLVVSTLLDLELASRAAAEGKALLVRTFVFTALVVVTRNIMLAFAYAQLVYAALWVLHFALTVSDKVSCLPALVDGNKLLLAEHRDLLVSFAGICVQKLLTTHGEKVLLLALFDSQAWGVFGLVSNLGSIILRLLFAPIEEIAFTSFSKRSSDVEDSQYALLLRTLLLLQGTVGWLAFCFGWPASGALLHVMYGEHWSSTEASLVLKAYCALLFLLAINGILEAYVYGRASSRWLLASQGASAVATALMLATAWILQDSGPVALVVANCIGMTTRVLFCVAFVASDSKSGPVGVMAVLFPPAFLRVLAAGTVGGLATLLAARAVAGAIEQPGRRALLQILVGGIFGLGTLFALRHDARAVMAELQARKKAE